MRKLLINLFLLCTGKDGIAMMAMLWAQEIMNPVSYTHLDVYKRQAFLSA